MKRFTSGRAAWLALVGLGLAASVQAANVLQTFFVPLPEDQMQVSLNAIDAYRGLIGDEMRSAISMVIGTDHTILYYDHWEDGYEDDITEPTQLTSQIWGDGDPDNGFPPGFPDDLLNAGDVVLLESTIDVTRNSVVVEYDGRDKVATTYPIAMTRGLYAIFPGEVLAEATGVFDVGTHGTLYRAPVGVGTGTGFGTNQMFSYTAFYIMADYDFTRIDLDKDNDGVFEETVYLDQGEPYFVNGGIVAGATVKGTQPFQCHLVTGDVGSTYEMRWFELWPESQWGTDYFTPVGTRTNLAGAIVPALVYLFNPNAETITVHFVTQTNSGSFTVAPNSVYDVFQMPLNSGARFTTTNGASFLGANVFDTTVGGGTLYGFVQHCQTYDWGIGLMPVNMMSTMGVVGWGPGQGTTGGGGITNGNPIWISALTNTTIYVDYDSNPDTGAFVDPLGNRYDFATNVTALQLVQLVDTNDIDQTGMRYYTLDGAVLMGAWGQDSARAGPGNPFLDMGYAIPAFPTVLSKKFASLLTDVNGNGYADSGDTIEYFIDIVNVGFATANNVIFQDDLPTNLTAYVTNSAMLASGGSTNAVPDSLPPKLTRFPFDEGGYNVGTIALGQTTTVRYVTQVLDDLPPGFDGFIHNNATVGGTNGNWSGGATIPVRIGGLSIQKQTSTTNLLEPGTNFTYTITVANTGTVSYTGVNIQDALPLGVSYVSNSATIQISGALTNTVSDRFNQRTFTNNNGTIPWLTAWTELNEADGVAAGGVQVRSDGTNTVPLEAYVLRLGNASRGATRQADLAGHTSATLSFDYRRSGLDGATDYAEVFISTNNWVSSNLLVRLQGAADETNRTPTNFNVSAYISTNTGLRVLTSATMGADDFVIFDNFTFTLTGSDATFAGTPPPVLAQNLTLPPGGTVTATFQVQVDNPPVATQAVNQARVRADQQQPWVDSNPVTNAIHATEAVTIVKSTSTSNLLVPGTNVTYSILIANTGTVWQTGIQLEDLLPFGMTYSNGTAELIRAFPHTNTFLDVFNSRAYTNSDGNVAWAGPWVEIGDDGDPTNGNIRILVDGGSIPGQTYALRTLSTAIVQRAANLAGYTSATLRFDYRRFGLETNEFVNISASANGGGTFTQIGQIGHAIDDGSYFPASYDISAYASTGTVIRFTGSTGRDTTTDIVWLDNIRIDASAASATNALGAPPALLAGYSLPPGTSMTVRLTATVDDPLVATNFINTARLISDQQTTWLTSRTTNAASGDIGLKLTKWTGLAANWDYGVTNDYYITIENTGTVAITGIRLTDALPAGVSYVTGSAQVVRFLVVETNEFWETVSDEFSTAAYNNNDGTTNWLGNWAETGDGATGAGSGNVLIRTAGGTNALVFENTDADNDFVTRTNPLAMTLPGRVYTNVTLSFAYRRQNWDATDSMTLYISTNGFGSQSNLVYTVPGSPPTTDATYSNFTVDVTSSMGAQMALRIRAGPNFANNDRINFDFVTFTNRGYDVVTNAVPDYSSSVVVSVVSNLVGNPTNLLVNYTLPAGTSVSVRIRGTLNVPLVSTQFVNTATVTNNQTPPQSAWVTNVSVANRVGDYVWSDVNGNGIQNGGEPGLTGVVVRLYSSASNLLLTTTSGVAGAYAFTNLPTGSYFLEFVTPTNYLPTVQDAGGDDALDSDISTNTGRTATFTLSGGTNDTSRDAGYYQPVSSIGNFVWRDVNGNGLQDGGAETGMPNVVVTLYDASSNAVGVTTSSAAGAYSITNLPTGYYFLEFTPPAGFTFTLQDQGGNDAVDSDVSPVTGRTGLFYLPPGTADDTRDAGLSAIVYGLSIAKTASAGDCLAAGATNTYTIVIQNTGTVAQSSITLEDVLPPGLTYVSDSVQATFYSPTGTIISATYNTSSTFTGPAGITSATVQAWGGGGGGAQRTSNGAGGGGGGGAYSRSALAVIPASSYTVTVGAAGAQNTTGGDSWFALGSVTGVLARGGTGGTLNNANGAAGGAAASGIGDVRYNGGNGANGVAGSYGGGGGSSAGTNAAGTSATVATGAVAPAGGGNGGNGKTTPEGAGAAGSAPGGGGGGALRTANNQNGGAGAAGRVIVSYDTSTASSGTVGAPPNLWTGGILGTGASVTITFQATVNAPASITQAVNTASAYSAVQPAIFSSVTNCVQFADVGVLKTATKTNPDQVEIIEYLLTVTNNGPSTATGVQITDVLPSLVQYNSHSNGTYNAGTGVWTVGTLGVGAAMTLYINVTVREGTGGVAITNTATLTGADLYDPNPSNDTSSVVIVPTGGAAVGDRVWFDTNRNGIQDPGETNQIANVPVALMTTNGVVVTSTVTSAEGTYLFENVLPGTYYIRFDLTNISTAVTLSPAGQGSDRALDSDVTNGATGDFAWTTNFTLAGGETNLTIDLGLMVAHGTRADLAEVWGEDAGGDVRIVWRTLSEWNTAGFFVYRVDPETGAEERMSPALVPSALEASGAIYELVDPQAAAGGQGVYRLEEVEFTGAVLDLGRHEVVFGPPPPAAKAARAEARALARAKAAPVKLSSRKLEGPSAILKATYRREGLYGLSLPAVADGMGLALEDVQTLAAEGRLALRTQGSLVAAIYDAAGDRLVFHGRATDHWYARDNAVLIFKGAGRAMPRRDPGAAAGDAVLPVQVRFEEDRYPFDSSAVLPEDFYYWDYLISGHATMGTRSFPLDLTGHAGGDVALAVRLQGWSSTTNDPDHLAEFRFNGELVGAATFDGQDVHAAALTVPAALVSNGVNTLAVKGVLQPGRSHSFFVVDRMDAAFERAMAPLAGTAHVQAGAAAALSAAAYEAPLTVALDRYGEPTWIADVNGTLPDKAWAVAEGEHRYALAEAAAIPLLTPEAVAQEPWFLAETNRIDYLIVVSRELEETVQELADYRAGQGLRVGVATFEDLCDWMAEGLRTPEAVPEMLAYAAGVWAEAPWLVLLAGNGHYDFLGALSNEVNHIPPMLLQTEDGIFAADNLMADSGGDDLPDVAIGRLPAITAADLAAMIAKIKAYEAAFAAPWQRELVFTSDRADAAAGDFAGANDGLAALAGGNFGVARIDLDTTPTNAAVPALLGHFNAGAGLIHYTGHGGVANWSAQGLLKKAHVDAMHNVRQPVVVALSCLVGRYEAPGPAAQSLGELLLRRAQGGAVAAWGPSGLSRNDPAAELGAAFYRAVLQEGSGTLGLAILRAVRGLERDLVSRDTLSVYNLLGDPALRLAGNTAGHAADENFAQWRWQRFSPEELADPEASAPEAALFRAYALAEGAPLRVEQPEFGFPLPGAEESGFVLRWKRRVRRADIDYRMFICDNLRSGWQPAEVGEFEELGAEPDPDGVMETVRTRIELPPARRVFIGVQAERK
jgi:uncharacterized repeat protein (TIGR01451 family)